MPPRKTMGKGIVMKENIVGFLTLAGIAIWFLAKHPYLLTPLLIVGAVGLAIFLFVFVVWYGLVQIRIFFRI